MENDWNNLPTWLPKQIAKVGMTVERFAWAAKLSRVSVYNYIQGTHRPSSQSMVRMCRVLGVTLEVGLRQYRALPEGRPKGFVVEPRGVRVRAR